MTYDDYIQLMRVFAQNYDKTHGGAPEQPVGDPQAEISGYRQPAGYDEAVAAYQKYNTDRGEAWLRSLTPAQRAEYNMLHAAAVKANTRKANRGALIALGVPLGAAAIGGLVGGGALGGGATVGSGAGGATVGGGAGGLGGAAGAYTTAAADSAAASAAGGFANLGAGSIPTGVNLGSLGGVIPTGVAGAGIPIINGAIGGTPSVPGGTPSVPGGTPSVPPGTPSGPGGTPNKPSVNWGNVLAGTGISAAALAAIQALQNKNKLPALPDFMKLAEQTAKSQNDAVNAQTLANRPNQINAYGDTLTWTIGPDGRPVQTTKFGAPNQQKFNLNNQAMLALQKQIAGQAGKPPPGLPTMGSVNTPPLTDLPVMGQSMANALRTVRVV